MVFPFAFLEGIGGPELLLIMFVVLLLFGANRLPELAKGFGKSMREFKKAASGVEQEFKQAMDAVEDEPKKPAERPRPIEGGLKTGANPQADLPPPPATRSRLDDGLDE